MGRRLLQNGDILYINGNIPKNIDGYEVDSSNPKLWHPKTKNCAHKIIGKGIKRSCGCAYHMYRCRYIRLGITQLQCVNCNHYLEGPNFEYDLKLDSDYNRMIQYEKEWHENPNNI